MAHGRRRDKETCGGHPDPHASSVCISSVHESSMRQPHERESTCSAATGAKHEFLGTNQNVPCSLLACLQRALEVVATQCDVLQPWQSPWMACWGMQVGANTCARYHAPKKVCVGDAHRRKKAKKHKHADHTTKQHGVALTATPAGILHFLRVGPLRGRCVLESHRCGYASRSDPQFLFKFENATVQDCTLLPIFFPANRCVP